MPNSVYVIGAISIMSYAAMAVAASVSPEYASAGDVFTAIANHVQTLVG